MPLRAIESQRLYQQVATQIADMIRRGEWAAGERLPPERNIAQLLGVSRPTVREAMLALELSGVVDVRTGAGTYVRRWTETTPPQNAANADSGPSPFEVIAARKVVEGELAFLAATRMSQDDVTFLGSAIIRLEREATLGTHECLDVQNADVAFHMRIATVAGNSVLESIVRNLWDTMRSPLFSAFDSSMHLALNATNSVGEHRVILARLADNDADGAREAMHHHLDSVERYLLRDN